jgi:hypothetical protein
MKTKLCGSIAVVSIMLFSTSPGSATTYTYTGTNLCGTNTTTYEENPIVVTSICGGAITGSVTFNSDTTGFSGSLSLADVASLSLGGPFAGCGYNNCGIGLPNLPYPPPNQPFSEFYAMTDGASFVLVNGSITSWLIQGGGRLVNCGGGFPLCFALSFGVTTSTGGDNWGGYDYYDNWDQSLGSSGPGVWSGPTPLPGALPLFATGLGALGLLGWRRKRKAAAAITA